MGDSRYDQIKDKVTKYLGQSSWEFIDQMMSASEGELEDQLTALLDEDLNEDEAQKRLFDAYRRSYDKLMHNEIVVESGNHPLSEHEAKLLAEMEERASRKGMDNGKMGKNAKVQATKDHDIEGQSIYKDAEDDEERIAKGGGDVAAKEKSNSN